MLVLASASPRRRHLLARLGLAFEVVEPEIDESTTAGRPERIARRLASAKARAVAVRRPDATIIGADTIVAYHSILFGKPADADEARAMLEFLRGRTHRVITAVAVLAPARTGARRGGRRRPLVDHAVTSVTIRRYTYAEIAASIARGEPFDKAGAYAIQDERLAPVARYDAVPAGRQSLPAAVRGLPADTRGCYCNVVGLPLWMAVRLLGRAGLDITHIEARDLIPLCAECPLR